MHVHGEPSSPAFLQKRLALFAASVFAISAACFALVTIASAAWPSLAAIRTPTATAWHAAQLALPLSLWLVTRFGARSASALAALDALFLSSVAVVHAAMASAVDCPTTRGLGPPAVPLAMATAVVLVTRAIVVPSSPRRTIAVSVLSACAMAVASALLHGDAPASAPLVVAVSLWMLVGVLVSALASRVVYGLHAEVREAKQLGQYTLEAKIGEGGMGVVYRARHSMLRRPTAVKLLAPGRSDSGDLARFEREVQATAALSHPNTIAIYDYGRTADGVFYYAMEYLEGLDLQALVDRAGPLPPARVAHVLDQVLGALAEAHDAGIVHGDVKPANLMLSVRGGVCDVVKVLDFGLAKRVFDDRRPRERFGKGFTGSTVITGTPLYLAPEAITAPDRADARSDLYAVGCVAYFLLTGRTPFDGETSSEVLAKHLATEPEPLAVVAPHVPEDLAALIHACLAKAPSLRPKDARAARALLRAARDLAPWTDEQAHAWWLENGDRVRARPGADVGHDPVRDLVRDLVRAPARDRVHERPHPVTSAVTVDLRARVAL